MPLFVLSYASKHNLTNPTQLVKKLHKTTASLKKYAHVNKKAFDQYNSFTTQRDEHLARRDELDKSAESIQELIETLDQRKDEAIERTFKQVSKYFEEVFEALVPAGRGQLIMQKKIDGYVVGLSPPSSAICLICVLRQRAETTDMADTFCQQDEESEDPTARKSEIDNYSGVSIRVSFNSKADEGQRIQQLSGGQKSLVALATGELACRGSRGWMINVEGYQLTVLRSICYPEMRSGAFLPL